MRKLFKKSLACVLAVALCLTALVGAISVSADVAGTITVAESVSFAADQSTVTFPVTFSVEEGNLSENFIDVSFDKAGAVVSDIALPEDVTYQDYDVMFTEDGNIERFDLYVPTSSPILTNAKEATVMVTVTISDAANAPFVLTFENYTSATYEEVAVLYSAASVTIEVAHVHSYDEKVTPPTCTTDGFTTYTCACGYEYTGNVVPATGHTAGAAVEENKVAATCTTDGSYDTVVYCTVCDAELSRTPVTVGATGHTDGEAKEENRVESTCAVAGSYDTVVYCTVCDAEISRETIDLPLAEHTPADAVEENRVEAQPGVEGSYDSVVYCSVCSAELSRTPNVIPALPTGPKVDEDIVINSTLNLQDKINITCSITNTTIAEYDEVKFEFVVDKCDGSYNFQRTTFIKEGSDLSTSSRSTAALFNDLGMYELNIPVTVTVLCYNDGVLTAKSLPVTKSAIQLTEEMYAKAANNADLRVALADITSVAYATQNYFKTNYPNSQLAALALPEIIEGGTAEMPTMDDTFSPNDVAGMGIGVQRVALNVSANPALTYVFTGMGELDADTTYVAFTYNSKKLGTVKDEGTIANVLTASTNGRYSKLFNKVALYDLNEIITFTIYSDSSKEEVLFTFDTSVGYAISSTYNPSNASPYMVAAKQISCLCASSRTYFKIDN